VKEWDLNIDEFHVYKGDSEVKSERQWYQNKLVLLKDRINESSLGSVFTNELFPKGIPISPFPGIQKCMGLTVQDLEFEIMEGFARLAYDFDVKPVDESCFFNIFEQKEDRLKRLANAFGYNIPTNLSNKMLGKLDKLSKQI